MALVHGNYTRDMQGGKKIRKKEQNICLLSKITKIKEKKKTKQKTSKNTSISLPPSALHETECDEVPNHATPPTPA